MKYKNCKRELSTTTYFICLIDIIYLHLIYTNFAHKTRIVQFISIIFNEYLSVHNIIRFIFDF